MSSIFSYGQVECIFDNPDKYILQESRDIFSRCPKSIRNSNSFKALNFSAICSSAHVKCNLDNPWNNFGKRPDKLVQLPKMIEEVQFFWKFFSQKCSYGQVEWMHFDKPGEKFSTQGRKTYAHWPKMKTEIKFDEKIFPQKCSFGNVKCNFVNPIGRSSLEGRSYYGRFPMINKKSFFLRSLNGDCYYGLWECSFLTKPTKISCKKLGIFHWK